jgi:uncharacterized Zn-finger protein
MFILSSHSRHFYEVKRHLCPICGAKFRFPLDLRVHISYHDSTGTSVVCDQCGKVYPHRKRLVQHLRVSHNKSKTYSCTQCERVFYEQYRLQKHLRIHTNVKPYKCAHCSYRSVRSDNVLLHVRKMHKKESDSKLDVVMDGGGNEGQLAKEDQVSQEGQTGATLQQTQSQQEQS